MSTLAANVDERFDSHENEACYIFLPGSGPRLEAKEPSPTSALSAPNSQCFASLLDGAEDSLFTELRYGLFKKLWSRQEARFDEILTGVNAGILDQVAYFVGQIDSAEQDGRIPTGLIVTGPSIASHHRLFSQITTRIRSDSGDLAVHLTSEDAPNLKSVLKILIKKAIHQITEFDMGHEPHSNRRRRILDYDLQVLHEHIQKYRIQRVVIAFQDSEAIDGRLLTELVCLFSSWRDRIPFALLFGIATSVSIFHERLSQTALRCMSGEQFDVERAEESLEAFFNDAHGTEAQLRPGPYVSGLLWNRHADHSKGAQSIVSNLKYLYMSHFYANPLSVLLGNEHATKGLESEHYEAIRNLLSFRRLVEVTLNSDDTQTVRSLLHDDVYLHYKVQEYSRRCQEVALQLLDVVAVLHTILLISPEQPTTQVSDIYIKAMSGGLHDRTIVRDALLCVKKMHSGLLMDLLNQINSLHLRESTLAADLLNIQEQLRTMLSTGRTAGASIRSGHDLRSESVRTTVTAQKIELSKLQATLSAEESRYTKLVTDMHKILETYFEENTTVPQEIFLHEIFFYDLRSPYRDVFTPKPRLAVERALSSPQDYLGCTCCGTSEEGLSTTQPASAILYQLYLESGALVNVFDLWSAFYAVVGGEDGEDCDEANALALFYRALADLKFMGMIKHSRKRPDHIAKLSWKGL